MARKKYVYLFADGKAEGQGDWKELLGGKGAGSGRDDRVGYSSAAGVNDLDRSVPGVLCVGKSLSGWSVG